MDRSQYLEALAADSDAFFAAVDTVAPGAPVPSCPEWTVGDLVYHLAEVQYFWAEVAARRLAAPDVVNPPRPPAEELVAWGRSESARLREVLATADPAEPVWTWAPQKDVAFIVRRMAQEAAVHRWDAERAAGSPSPIERELAVDGIAEFLEYFLPRARAGAEPIGGSVHLHATDGAGEWFVREDGDGGLTITAEHAKGDAAVRAPASDLLLLLWRRVPAEDVEVLGDRGVADRFLARAALG